MQQRCGSWVGLSVVHLGDRDVPNALIFIDKYTQVSRILTPIVQCIESLRHLVEDPPFHSYVSQEWGSIEGLRLQVRKGEYGGVKDIGVYRVIYGYIWGYSDFHGLLILPHTFPSHPCFTPSPHTLLSHLPLTPSPHTLASHPPLTLSPHTLASHPHTHTPTHPHTHTHTPTHTPHTHTHTYTITHAHTRIHTHD